MSNWNQAICERCWINKNTDHDQYGNPYIRMPVTINREYTEVERCAYCGLPTIFGCFVRANPATVPYPSCEHEFTKLSDPPTCPDGADLPTFGQQISTRGAPPPQNAE
jgi:hypothetical protein